ncbi:MAG TPA: GlsB/YeaQ/YmgE family stress response membrane protein [Acidimicrobiales bacterium]|nr:GlsB/YeaQ/YmgE family stress response membrane protein [Acidimicrobiales bacterium]
MGIIGWIVLGLIAGLIAKVVMPGDDPGGVIVTALIGIVGALLGGFLASALFDINVNKEFFDLATWVAAIVGALILLALYRVFAGGRTTARR